jgi:hypothetical protein
MTTEVERRLERAFAGLGDERDRTDHTAPLNLGQLDLRPRRRGSRLGTLLTASAVTAVGLTLAFLLAPDPTAPAPPPPAAVPHDLGTHCGIDETKFGDTYYEAVTPLHDGAHNPPPGWGNPVQPGSITVLTGGEAVFRDDQGHEILFRARPEATAFKHLCQ